MRNVTSQMSNPNGYNRECRKQREWRLADWHPQDEENRALPFYSGKENFAHFFLNNI